MVMSDAGSGQVNQSLAVNSNNAPATGQGYVGMVEDFYHVSAPGLLDIINQGIHLPDNTLGGNGN